MINSSHGRENTWRGLEQGLARHDDGCLECRKVGGSCGGVETVVIVVVPRIINFYLQLEEELQWLGPNDTERSVQQQSQLM